MARTRTVLEQTAEDIHSASNMVVNTVACDITTAEGRALALAACPQPDILVTNAGGPPAGDFRDWDREQWMAALDANMLTPIELIKATVDGMMARRFGRIINITSSAVKAPIDILGLSNGARAGLTGFVTGLARTTALHNVTINNLFAGTVLYGSHAGDAEFFSAQAAGRTLDEEIDACRRHIPAQRFGTTAEFGAVCAFLCSTHAGYMTGRNVLLDGGEYPGDVLTRITQHAEARQASGADSGVKRCHVFFACAWLPSPADGKGSFFYAVAGSERVMNTHIKCIAGISNSRFPPGRIGVEHRALG
ncbi:SDR family oxidoreductase [Undibacterium arcticum]